MRAVRIPAKVAAELRECVAQASRLYQTHTYRHLLEALDAALEDAKPGRAVKAARGRAKAKKAARREETAEIRRQVFERARGLCEMCGAGATDLEHAFGRVRVKQAASNCLALCRECHRGRTLNRPSAAYWLEQYAAHFKMLGHESEARMAAVLAAKERNASLPASLPLNPSRNQEQP